jgi:hypothetical protein
LEAALDLPGQPVKRGTMAHDHDVTMLLAEAAGQLGDAAALATYAPRLEELAARDDHRLYRPIAHRALGVAARLRGDYGEAEAQFGRALAAFQQIGARWQAGRTLVELGELARARSNGTAAQEAFAQALAAFEEVQAAPDADRARRRLAGSTLP